jgi:TRAP-type uncharacterized transport system substrate-binding protein
MKHSIAATARLGYNTIVRPATEEPPYMNRRRVCAIDSVHTYLLRCLLPSMTYHKGQLMNNHLLRTLLVYLLGSVAGIAYAQQSAAPTAAPVVISSGVEGGGYWNAGSSLQAAASGMGMTVQNLASDGSLNNLNNLLNKNSPVSLAFTQADALHYYLNDHRDAEQAVEPLAGIGDECVFIITDAEGDIHTLEDMVASPRVHLGIKSPTSGIRVTWDYMAALMPGLRDITVVYGDAVEMMTAMAHPLTNIEKAVMVVQGPDERSPEIDMVSANPERFRFVQISNQSLTRKTASNETVYRSMKVKPGAVSDADPVETICVRGLLVANKSKLTSAQRTTLKELIAKHWTEVSAAKP